MAPKYSVTIWVGSPKHRKGPKSHNGWESLDLQAVLLLQGLVLLPEGVDTVNHGLDEGDLGVSQPVLVGHVVGAAIEATRLSTGSTGLDCELLAPLLQSVKTLLGVSGQVNHDGGPHAGNDEVAVTGDKEEVVVDQLLADLLVHASQGVVGAGEVTGQLGEGALQQALNTQPLLLG